MSDSHYVDNKKFFEAMKEWKKEISSAHDSGDETPPVPEYIGECFILIAERLSMRANFINYPYRDEMIGDAIENCLMYASNFDPDKSSNPFSYFTQIIYYAFLRRIQNQQIIWVISPAFLTQTKCLTILMQNSSILPIMI